MAIIGLVYGQNRLVVLPERNRNDPEKGPKPDEKTRVAAL